MVNSIPGSGREIMGHMAWQEGMYKAMLPKGDVRGQGKEAGGFHQPLLRAELILYEIAKVETSLGPQRGGGGRKEGGN